MSRTYSSPNLLIYPLDPQPSRAYHVRATSKTRTHTDFMGVASDPDFAVCTYYDRVVQGINCPSGRVGDTIIHNREKRVITEINVLRKKDIQPMNRPRVPKNPWCWLVYLKPLR